MIDNSKDQPERDTALEKAIQEHAKMPAANVAAGGRSLSEEAARFLRDAQAAAARRDK